MKIRRLPPSSEAQGADGQLAEQFEGQGRIADRLQEELVELPGEIVELAFALGSQPAEQERVRIHPRLPGDPRFLDSRRVVQYTDRTVQLIDDAEKPLGLRLLTK